MNSESRLISVNDGYLVNINKPADWTSFDVVRKIRGITRIRKVGHAGTLDPFATGVLIVAIGKSTKVLTQLTELDKEYHARLLLGKTTDTLDPTGRETETREIPFFDIDSIESAFRKFTGVIQQRIPDYSAAKVDGRRLYSLARQGKEVPARFKMVTISEMELLAFSADNISFRVSCSRGTYIRTLGADIARELGTVGHLIELTRTKIGNFRLEDSMEIADFQKEWEKQIADEDISKH